MEPTLIKNNKIFNNQKKIIVTLIVFLVCLFIGTSYSILTSNDETEEVISFQAGDLNLEVKTNTDTSVNFPDELPKSEEEVEKPIILNIKNIGSLTICEYRLKLVADTSPDSPASDLPIKYIRYAVSEDNGISYNESKLLSETNNQIYIGFDLKKDATKNIYVKVWLDEEVLDNEEVLNKHFYGKIDAELLQRCETFGTAILKETLGKDGGIIGVTNDNLKVTEETNNIREYRYSGLGVNNYVTFNDEPWRIIGIFKDDDGQEHIKIVRDKMLEEELLPTNYVADGKNFYIKAGGTTVSLDCWGNDNDNNWADAGLMHWLNSTGEENGYLKTLSSDAQKMIENAKWYLGTVTIVNTVSQDTSIESYQYERAVTGCIGNKGPSENNNETALIENSSCRVWANNAATWIGKIALMYPSDYGFSASDSYWRGTKLISNDMANTSWFQKEMIHTTTHEWFMSPSSNIATRVSIFVPNSGVADGYAHVGRNIRPTLYLKSNTIITSGKGTSIDPYTLQS